MSKHSKFLKVIILLLLFSFNLTLYSCNQSKEVTSSEHKNAESQEKDSSEKETTKNSKSINLLVPDYPPYNFEENGKATGVAVKKVQTIMENIGYDVSFKVMPNFERTIEEVRLGNYDGFFIASQNEERDEIAVISEPIISVNRVWVIPKGSKWTDPDSEDFKKNAKIGSQFGSKLYDWLEDNGYNNAADTGDEAALIKMLDSGRLDALYIVDEVFKYSADEIGINESDFDMITQLSIPTGVYVSKKYLKEYPDFMNEFNKGIKNVE